MTIKALNLKATVLILLIAFASAANAEGVSDYRLGSGDLVRIVVFNEPELSFEVRLSDAGTFSYPFLGEIRVSGKTLGQLEGALTEGLKDGFLVDPEVNISVVEYRPFFIHGEVKEPGSFPYQPGLTLRKAIALAGGFTERASRTKIFVLAEANHSVEQKIEMNDSVRPGDIVSVKQSFF